MRAPFVNFNLKFWNCCLYVTSYIFMLRGKVLKLKENQNQCSIFYRNEQSKIDFRTVFDKYIFGYIFNFIWYQCK